MPDFSDLSRSPTDSGRSASPVRTKAEIRTRLTAARRSLPARTRHAADAALRAALVAFLAARRAKVVAAYAPQPREPGGADLPDALAAATRTVLLPVVGSDRDLDWAVHTGDLRTGRYGLREPAGRRLGADAIATADLVVVPALAADRRGARLGRGRGYYDRALARTAPGALVLALLYDGELLDALPTEPHDRPVHGAVTPTGVVLLTALDETGSDVAPLALEE